MSSTRHTLLVFWTAAIILYALVVGFQTLRRVVALALIAISIVLNGILLVRALLRGESLALIRLLSMACLLYGFRIFSHWPNG
jgi:hypothetical protein